ncbi:unnamed protein product [Heterobilharzia americana]|nr:unnamed protein product [Heterobilharzia americana]
MKTYGNKNNNTHVSIYDAIQQDSINVHDAECAALIFGERMKERLVDLEEKLRILKSCLVESHKSNYQLKISKVFLMKINFRDYKIMGIIESNYGEYLFHLLSSKKRLNHFVSYECLAIKIHSLGGLAFSFSLFIRRPIQPNEEHVTMYKKLHRIYRAHGSNQYRHEQCYYHFPSKHRMDVEKLSELIREMYAAKSQFVRDSLIQKAYERMAFYLQGSSGKLHFVSDSNPFQF